MDEGMTEIPGQMAFEELQEYLKPGVLLAVAENGLYREVLYVDDEYVAVKPDATEKHGWVYSHQYIAELADKAVKR